MHDKRKLDAVDALLNIVVTDRFRTIQNLTDLEFRRVFSMGLRALFVQTVAKSQEAIASITPDDLAACTGPQKAIIAGIMADKAEKLAGLLQVEAAGGEGLKAEDFQELMRAIRGQVTRLTAMGVELTIAPNQGAAPSGTFGAEPIPETPPSGLVAIQPVTPEETA